MHRITAHYWKSVELGGDFVYKNVYSLFRSESDTGYILLILNIRTEGFEPPILRSRTRFRCLLKSAEVGCFEVYKSIYSRGKHTTFCIMDAREIARMDRDLA